MRDAFERWPLLLSLRARATDRADWAASRLLIEKPAGQTGESLFRGGTHRGAIRNCLSWMGLC